MSPNNQSEYRHSELWLVLKTIVGEYRQNPLLNLGFILSLAIATSTLLAILILNHASKQQYQQAEARLESPIAFHIVAKQGRNVSRHDFVRLRQQGFSEISPVISWRKQLPTGQWLSFKAMDLLALSIAKPQRFDSDNVLLPVAYAKRLGLKGPQLTLTDGQVLPMRTINVADWGMTALLDIALAWQLFPELFSERNDFSYLMVSELTPARAARLQQSLPSHLSLQQSWSLKQRAGFADALHLNLSALAALGFVVSLFIAFQGADQAWRKRHELVTQLRLFGVSLATIRQALLIEALLLIVVASIVGALLAVAVVAVLLPLLGLTLNQLYQLKVSGHFDWNWRYAIWSLLITTVAVCVALAKQIKQLNNRKLALATKAQIIDLPLGRIGAAASLLLLLFALWPQTSWFNIMLKYGWLLVATVALLPLALNVMIRLLLLGVKEKGFRSRFMLQDAANQIGRRFLPLAAFYLALTTSISAALMVNSFETAFVKYLNQQLSEDLYVRFNRDQKPALEQWLQSHEQVTEFLLYRHGVANVGQDTVAINTHQSARQLGSLMIKSGSPSIDTRCLINEQLALKHQLVVGSELVMTQGAKRLSCEIGAIYFDYGNPGFEMTLAQQWAVNNLSGLSETGFGLYINQYDSGFKQQLIQDLALDDSQLIEPDEIKQLALNIFSQTFVLTQAIAAVLLAIACFGLFLSAKSLELARRAELLTLSSLGYSRLALLGHMLAQWLLLAGGCIILSWPTAIVLGWVLVTKVFPASFGWSMPIIVEAMPFMAGSLIGLVCLLPALMIPLYRLRLGTR